MRLLFALATIVVVVHARCPNDCSGHGMCGSNSQCKCYRNWMASDCSERVCYYSYAFVDTPLGDLNADGAIDMTVNMEEEISEYALEGYSINYGAARVIDGDSEKGRWDEGHFYRECANKGLCNRKTGQCDCFPGYEGEGCQRTSCPGSATGEACSGHGLCLSAYNDYATTDYNLWDSEKTMKCQCDPGYSGPDCSLRACPVGPDPVYHSDKVTTSLQKITWGAFSKNETGSSTLAPYVNGNVYFTITVTDDFGDEWTTNSLTVEYATSCADESSAWTDTTCVVYPYQSTSASDMATTDVLADSVNNSLAALPNGAVRDNYVWQQYVHNNGAYDHYDTDVDNSGNEYGFRYPYDLGDDNGQAEYWVSAATRFPDFGNTDGVSDVACQNGRSMNPGETLNTDGDSAVEGLCIFISSSNDVGTNYKVTYTYNTVASPDAIVMDTVTGVSTDLEGWTLAAGGTAVAGSGDNWGTDDSGNDIPFVTVADVGDERYWDVNVDGYPALSYTDFSTDECSKRGLCDYETGTCDCFSGYTGIACGAQNAITYSA